MLGFDLAIPLDYLGYLDTRIFGKIPGEQTNLLNTITEKCMLDIFQKHTCKKN